MDGILDGCALMGSLFKGIAALAAPDQQNIPRNKLTPDQTGVAKALGQSFNPQGYNGSYQPDPNKPGYTPSGSLGSELGVAGTGLGYTSRLNQLQNQLGNIMGRGLPTGTQTLPTGPGVR